MPSSWNTRVKWVSTVRRVTYNCCAISVLLCLRAASVATRCSADASESTRASVHAGRIGAAEATGQRLKAVLAQYLPYAGQVPAWIRAVWQVIEA